MGSKPTKKQRVLRYLRGGTSLTPREAIDFFNAYRLAGIVHELNKEGYNIKESLEAYNAKSAKKRQKTKTIFEIVV